MADTKEVRVKFTKELEDILKEMEINNSYPAFELLWMSEPGAKYYNGLGISEVGVSKVADCFRVVSDRGTNDMKIVNFLRFYFKNVFKYGEEQEFLVQYDRIKNGGKMYGDEIKVQPFKYNPKDVRSTFLSLVTKTYPHGHEDEVLQFLPKLEKDVVGNYYHLIGENPTTMFTSHLDTADRQQKVTKIFSVKEEAGECFITDGNSILGADDKAGVAVMLYMMANNVPGLYYFFIGEERGGIGSNALSAVYHDQPLLKDIKRCVSFDRRDTRSVITQQLGRVCCSNEFGTALAKQYNSLGLSLSLDPTGIYTDSASFLENIPECTNISVGYYREHTGQEKQNITYLEKLAKASVSVDWNSLPTVRKIGLDQEIVRKHGALINDIKRAAFYSDVKVVGEEGGGASIAIDCEEGDINSTYETLTSLQFILNKHKVEQMAFFDGDYIKIELK